MTYLEFSNRLPPDVRKKFRANCQKLNFEIEDMPTYEAFTWTDTPEGYSFWQAISEEYDDHPEKWVPWKEPTPKSSTPDVKPATPFLHLNTISHGGMDNSNSKGDPISINKNHIISIYPSGDNTAILTQVDTIHVFQPYHEVIEMI